MEMAKLITSMNFPPETVTETNIPGVKIYYGMTYTPSSPVLYDPGICILLQGKKVVCLGKNRYQYDVDNYLIASVAVPLEVEVFGDPDNPVVGIIIDIDIIQLHDLIAIVGYPSGFSERITQTQPQAIGPVKMDDGMRSAIERMGPCLQNKSDALALGPGLVKEVLYRVLKGPQAPSLFALANHNGNFSRIAHVLRIIQTEYAKKMDVEFLAREARMGVSAFHQAFKDVTSESPMQFLKKVRLIKAKDMIEKERLKTYIAADMVGYESSSQFSREFKRYFNISPSEVAQMSKQTVSK